jgi:hypothetical protein
VRRPEIRVILDDFRPPARLTICPANPSLPGKTRDEACGFFKAAPLERRGWKTGVLMKIASSFAVITMASLLCAGASLAQTPSNRSPAGLSEGVPEQSMSLRNALAAPAPLPPLVIPPATNEWLSAAAGTAPRPPSARKTSDA